VRQLEQQGGSGGPGPVRAARLAVLEAAHRQLEQENQFLRRAAAFFDREFPQPKFRGVGEAWGPPTRCSHT
jgi:transposase-like protein